MSALVSPAPTTAPTPATAATYPIVLSWPPSRSIAMIVEEHVERTEEGDRPAQDRHDGKQPAVAEHRPQACAELGEQALGAGRCPGRAVHPAPAAARPPRRPSASTALAP